MTLKSLLLLVLPAMLAIGCAAEPASDDDGTSSDAISTKNNADLKEPSPEKPEPAASATTRDAVVDKARADQLVGEESTGYLGLVTDSKIVGDKKAASDLEARVNHINIQRRAIYTDLATKDGATVSQVAQTAACILFRDKVKLGEAYRTENAEWRINQADIPMQTPSFCVTQ